MLKKETIYVIYKKTVVLFRGIIDKVTLAKDFSMVINGEKVKKELCDKWIKRGIRSVQNSFNLHSKSNKVYPVVELEEDEYNKLKEEK